MTKSKLKDGKNAAQVKRFEKVVQDLIDAGELNPIEAEKLMAELVKKSVSRPSPSE